MSIILITEHNESIYNTTKDVQAKYRTKVPRYISRFRQVKPRTSTNVHRKTYGTMGVPKQDLPDPAKYLKKHTRKEFKVILTDTEQSTKSKVEPVPATADLLAADKARIRPPKKNFVSVNIKNVIDMKVRDPEQREVIDRFGVSKKITAGLEPEYIYMDSFGKTPDYLARLIKIRDREVQNKKDHTGTQQPKCRYITREQREDLLSGLKQNWEELQQKYQGLPILTDTIPKILRKSKLEQDLKQLEKDIVLLERHPYVYVYADNDFS